ncbi:MAG: glycerophosphodiester phosphodiesterase [Actinomycetota bacterium]|nr:glycerophosphodiester phosphodiesterase [Actinomycetota bacterium]
MTEVSEAGTPVPKGAIAVIAHRGASRVERENTLAAFLRAGQMGAQAVELDVRRTADGVLVVHHNPHLDDGRVISTLGFGQLPGHVPTLGAALDACAGMWVNVEIKNDPDEPDFDPTDSIADDTIAHLVARGTDDRWLISAFRIETVDRCRALAPQIRTAWLCVEAPEGVADLMVKKGHLAVHPWVAALTRSTVDACHAAGVQVNTWTCDDPARMRELIEWGIDGICTNVPDVALEVLGRAGG